MGQNFHFNLSVGDIKAIKKDEAAGQRVFLVLVCGEETICPVSSDDLLIVASSSPSGGQQVWVTAEAGKFMRFGKGKYQIAKTIPHNSYPLAVLR